VRQVIEGKLYDTETATLIHNWTNGRYAGDFKFREKSLFCTKKGAYFIHHVGGAMTDMAVPAGNGMGGSQSIEPIDETTAIRFLESHGGSEKIIEYFPEYVEEA